MPTEEYYAPAIQQLRHASTLGATTEEEISDLAALIAFDDAALRGLTVLLEFYAELKRAADAKQAH